MKTWKIDLVKKKSILPCFVILLVSPFLIMGYFYGVVAEKGESLVLQGAGVQREGELRSAIVYDLGTIESGTSYYVPFRKSSIFVRMFLIITPLIIALLSPFFYCRIVRDSFAEILRKFG